VVLQGKKNGKIVAWYWADEDQLSSPKAAEALLSAGSGFKRYNPIKSPS
jgi:hypothetical protein